MPCEICGDKNSKLYEDRDEGVVWELCGRCKEERCGNMNDVEPENRTQCPHTGDKHDWVWDSNADDWVCSLCGWSHEHQEEHEAEEE